MKTQMFQTIEFRGKEIQAMWLGRKEYAYFVGAFEFSNQRDAEAHILDMEDGDWNCNGALKDVETLQDYFAKKAR